MQPVSRHHKRPNERRQSGPTKPMMVLRPANDTLEDYDTVLGWVSRSSSSKYRVERDNSHDYTFPVNICVCGVAALHKVLYKFPSDRGREIDSPEVKQRQTPSYL